MKLVQPAGSPRTPTTTIVKYSQVVPGCVLSRAAPAYRLGRKRSVAVCGCRDLDYIHIFRTYVCIALERQSPLLRAYSDFAVANNEYLIFKR